jgi:DNA invertase Pin-like site-specific DNA recombinase
MDKRAAIYLRVSTDEQTTEFQERALREDSCETYSVSRRRNWMLKGPTR